MKALETLRMGLKAFSLAPMQTVFEPPLPLQKYAKELAAKFDSPVEAKPPIERILPALRRVLESGQIQNARDLKYICFGLPNEVEVGPMRRRVLSTPAAFEAVYQRLASVAAKMNTLRGPYLGLLASYFAIDGQSASEPTRSHWLRVRAFLEDNLSRFMYRKVKPRWAQLLIEHSNVFRDAPCDRYAVQILAGDKAQIEALTKGLGLPDHTWFFREAAFAAIKAARSLSHKEFQEKVPLLVGLIQEHPVIQNQGLAQILNRYAEIPGQPEHPLLLKVSLALWHNPLYGRHRKAWDQADEKATRMVSQWLKLTLIDDFFQHLSEDGATDKRRVRFWKQYVDSIENMYFALGSKAAKSKDADVKRLRETMGDSLLYTGGTGATNNGFFMVMKSHLICEFGQSGNAVYIFRKGNLPFELQGTISLVGRMQWRELAGAQHLEHMDNVHGYWQWEERFKAFLTSELGVRPDAVPVIAVPPAAKPRIPNPLVADVRSFCAKRGVRLVVDEANRQLIVHASATNQTIASQLRDWHFSYNNLQARWERSF